MDIKDIVAPADVIIEADVGDKAALLRLMAAKVAKRAGCVPETIVDAVAKRESLGSTGMGGGIALPHARLDAVSAPVAVLARLKKAIGFEAVDGQPVDLVCLLLLPASSDGTHLRALASVARILRDQAVVGRLRSAPNAKQLYQELTRS
jgi:PTS system nitrogen regulatory IIA component